MLIAAKRDDGIRFWIYGKSPKHSTTSAFWIVYGSRTLIRGCRPPIRRPNGPARAARQLGFGERVRSWRCGRVIPPYSTASYHPILVPVLGLWRCGEV